MTRGYMLTHAQAKSLADSLGLTPAESLFLRAVAWHETRYSAGWGPPDRGGGSWNMGAVTTSNPDQYSFKHEDSRWDPKQGRVVQYTTWFAGYPSALAGLSGLRDVLMKANVVEALGKNDFLGAVSAMYDNRYFLGLHPHDGSIGDRDNIEAYYTAVVNAVQSIGAQTGETQPDVLT